MSIFEKKFKRSECTILGVRIEGSPEHRTYHVRFRKNTNGQEYDRPCTKGDYKSACDSLGIPFELMLDPSRLDRE